MADSHPTLSIVVVAYRMRRQAMNTLYSLSTPYQHGVNPDEYEVIVVENRSPETLEEADVLALGPNYRYHLRDEPGVSPATAINFGLAQCRGDQIGLIIDGARMVTPGVVANALVARAVDPAPLVVVPGYYLTEEAAETRDPTGTLADEAAWLETLGWQANGYRLFNRARFSEGNRNGYLQPIMECNALFANARAFAAIGGADPRFDLPGGGSLNLHMYRSLAINTSCRLVTLAGEGNFHQFHGGTSTTPGEERERLVKAFNEQLNTFWNGNFTAVAREPTLLGTVGPEAMRFLQSSSELAQRRFDRLQRNGKPLWPDGRAAGK